MPEQLDDKARDAVENIVRWHYHEHKYGNASCDPGRNGLPGDLLAAFEALLEPADVERLKAEGIAAADAESDPQT